MSKLIRGALLVTLLYVCTQCGGTSGDVSEDTGASGAGQSGSGGHAGDAGAKTGGSGGAGGLVESGGSNSGHAGAQAAGAAGAAGSSSASGNGGAAAAGAAGAPSGVGCGAATCGANEYCRAPCSGIGFGFGGTAGIAEPMPSCSPLPAACNGTPTCDCICGVGSSFGCSTGSKPLSSGAVQCGCA